MFNERPPSQRKGVTRATAQGTAFIEHARSTQHQEPIMAKKDTQTVKDIAARVAKAKGIPNAEAAKLTRGRIRSQAKVITPHWPQLDKVGKTPTDGNRYPEMPAKLADALVANLTKGTKLADALKRQPRAPKAPKVETPPETPTEA